MFNKHDISRDACQLFGAQGHRGYDWWWHSFTGYDAETGAAKPFFIEFFLCNPSLGGEAPVFGQLPENQAAGRRPSYLMVKAGSWGDDAAQLHRFWGWKQIKVDWGVPFSVEADDCFLTETETRGHIRIENAETHPEWMCDNGEMSWKLQIDKQVAFNVGFGADKVFRTAEAFEMFWHAEGMKTAFTGEVVWNGRRYRVSPEDCYGYADKNWGKDFTSPWVWLSSNNLTSELSGKKLTDSVFDIGGGRPKVGHLALPHKLLSAFWYEGKPYEFNFSKAWTHVRTSFDCRETDTQIVWHVEQRSNSGRMVTDITCEKKDMLLVNYESPDGAKRHKRLWNGGNGVGTVQLFDPDGRLVDRIHAENVGCEYGDYDQTV
ncbi:MAG: hypothetical protein IJQ69_01665 [Bacteroidales bacterium]|nr:hypothetical protein [Bacteroidales bacterium]